MDIESSFEAQLRRAQKAALFLAYAGAVSIFGSLLSLALPEPGYGYGYAFSFALSALAASYLEGWVALVPSLFVSGAAIFLALMLAKMKKAAVFLAPTAIAVDTVLLLFFPLLDYGIYQGSSGVPIAWYLAIGVHAILLVFLALFLSAYAKLFRLNKERTSYEQH